MTHTIDELGREVDDENGSIYCTITVESASWQEWSGSRLHIWAEGYPGTLPRSADYTFPAREFHEQLSTDVGFVTTYGLKGMKLRLMFDAVDIEGGDDEWHILGTAAAAPVQAAASYRAKAIAYRELLRCEAYDRYCEDTASHEYCGCGPCTVYRKPIDD